VSGTRAVRPRPAPEPRDGCGKTPVGRARPRATALAVVALAALCAACGYTLPVEDRTQAVALQIAGNATMRQRVEIPLTRALGEALVVYSPRRLAARDAADVILEVDIEDARNQLLVSGRPEPVSEGAIALAASVRLVDAATGRVLRRFRVIDRAEFRVAVGEGEADAIREATTDLARKIVLGLEGGF